MALPSAPPIVLIAAARERSLAGMLQHHTYAVVHLHTGTLAVAWARDVQPDVIILEAELADMSGIEACRMLHNDPRIGHSVPILILSPDKPSPEQRVAALRAGAWDFLRYPRDPDELALGLQAYVQAKRNIDQALAEGMVDPATGLHSRQALARRARELVALMVREHGALACVVFAIAGDRVDAKTGSLLVRAARVSDVVGALSATEFAVLAPATDGGGAVKLARRIANVLRAARDGGGTLVPGSNLLVGYDAVANLTYSPVDPVELLGRAAAAVRSGTPEPDYAWVRRYHAAAVTGQESAATPAVAPSRIALEKGRTSV